MINSLATLLFPLTFMLIFLLFVRKSIRKNTDAHTAYHLWLLVPLTLVLYALPMPWQHATYLNEANIQQYFVLPTQNLSVELLSNNALQLGLTSLWSIGFIMLCCYWLINHLQFSQALKLNIIKKSSLSNIYSKSLCAAIPGKLTIAQSSHIYSPLLVGLFKQVLVIPEDFEELYSAEQQELIIAHEVCHFSQNHMWTNQIALLLLALFWFHPLAWRAYASFRQDQEHSCDQFVLSRKQTKSRIQYCKALVLAAETSPPTAFTLMNFNHNGEQTFMLNRIEQIKNMTKVKTSKLALIGVIATSLLATVSYAGNNQVEQEAKTTKSAEARPTYRVEPKYPVNAAREKIEGSVVLKFDINTDGSVMNVVVVNGKPAYVFDKTAITALQQWRYQPTATVLKNQLVQLDYLMSEASSKPASLIERIKVTK